MTGKTIKVIVTGAIGFATARTFAKAMAENPDDIEGAIAKSGRTALCGIGIVADIISMFVLAFVLNGLEIPIPHAISLIIQAVQLYTIYGLIRVARGKTFLINPAAIYQKIRNTRVPKIAYVGIELLITVLATKPVLNFIDGFTVRWAAQNQDAPEKLIITLGVIMLIGSIIIAAIIGLIVCRLIKAVTAK